MKLSVLIPVYNEEVTVTHVIEEVEKVNLGNIEKEIIVIDDGSTDDTKERIKAWSQKCQEEFFAVHYVYHAHRGAPAARNHGAIISEGEFIDFFDSDDLMFPNRITKLVQSIRDQGTCFAVCDCAKMLPGPAYNFMIQDYSNRSHDVKTHVRESVLRTGAAIYRRDTIRTIGPWDETLGKLQDFEFTFRLLAANHRGVWIPEILCLIRDSKLSISNQEVGVSWETMLEACQRVEAVAKEQRIYDNELADCIGRRLATLSRHLAVEGEWSASQEVFKEARARMRPRKKTIHTIHRVLMHTIGPSVLKRLRLM